MEGDDLQTVTFHYECLGLTGGMGSIDVNHGAWARPPFSHELSHT